jgi:hypothetical protein
MAAMPQIKIEVTGVSYAEARRNISRSIAEI